MILQYLRFYCHLYTRNYLLYTGDMLFHQFNILGLRSRQLQTMEVSIVLRLYVLGYPRKKLKAKNLFLDIPTEGGIVWNKQWSRQLNDRKKKRDFVTLIFGCYVSVVKIVPILTKHIVFVKFKLRSPFLKHFLPITWDPDNI